MEYFPLDETEDWKVKAIKEIIDVKNNKLDIKNLNKEEIEEILRLLCKS